MIDNPSDTPRTDAVNEEIMSWLENTWTDEFEIMKSHAEQLEGELAVAEARVKELVAAAQEFNDSIYKRTFPLSPELIKAWIKFAKVFGVNSTKEALSHDIYHHNRSRTNEQTKHNQD